MASKRNSKKRKTQFTGIVMIIVGFASLLTVLLWKQHKLRILSFTGKTPLQTTLNQTSKATEIDIPDIKLKMPIKESQIVDGVWQTFEGYANHLEVSANPGSGGNIVIYAHNKNSEFGPIRWMNLGQEISVTNEKGEKYLYRVVKIAEVNPSNMSYVLPKPSEVLTLYTCSGIFDSKRFIVVAEPVK